MSKRSDSCWQHSSDGFSGLKLLNDQPLTLSASPAKKRQKKARRLSFTKFSHEICDKTGSQDSTVSIDGNSETNSTGSPVYDTQLVLSSPGSFSASPVFESQCTSYEDSSAVVSTTSPVRQIHQVNYSKESSSSGDVNTVVDGSSEQVCRGSASHWSAAVQSLLVTPEKSFEAPPVRDSNKKGKFLKDGTAQRLMELVKRLKSEVNFHRHRIETLSQNAKESSAVVTVLSVRSGSCVTFYTCSSDSPLLDSRFKLIVSNSLKKSLAASPGDRIELHQPWHRLQSYEYGQVIVRAGHVNCIQEASQTSVQAHDEEVRDPLKLHAMWECTCKSDEDVCVLRPDEALKPVRDYETSCSPIFTSTESQHLRDPSQVCKVSVDGGNQPSADGYSIERLLTSGGSLGDAAPLTATVLCCYWSLDDCPQQSLVLEDSSGLVGVFRCNPDWAAREHVTRSSKIHVSSVRVDQRLTKLNESRLFEMVERYWCSPASIPSSISSTPQLSTAPGFCYLLQPTPKCTLTILSQNSSSEPEPVVSLATALQTPGRHDCMLKIMLRHNHMPDAVCWYVQDNEMSGARVKLITERNLPSELKNSWLRVNNISSTHNELLVDEFTSFEAASTPSTPPPLLPTVSDTAHINDLVSIQGCLKDVDDETACTWSMCRRCRSQRLTREHAWFRCTSCGDVVRKPALCIRLNVILRPDHCSRDVTVKLLQETIVQLLPSCDDDQHQEYEVDDLIGQQISPLPCIVQSTSPIVLQQVNLTTSVM